MVEARALRGARPSLVAALCLAPLLLAGACARKAPPALERLGRVSDYAGVVSPETEAALAAELDGYERETCHNVAVLIVPSLKGESITDLSARTALAWGIVEPVLRDGILLTVAIEEGQARIEMGTAMQSIIEEGAAGRILREEMVPSFREKDFDAGIAAGVRAIMEEARGLEIPDGMKPAACRP